MLFSKIVCPIDFDDNFLAALVLAAALTEENGATLYLLHIARVPPQDMDVPVPFEPEPRWEREARLTLEQIAHTKLKGRVEYQIRVLSGLPDVDIAHAVDDIGADLIVMTTHGRAGFSHLILGSVAEQVIRDARCPVLIVKSRTHS